MGGACPTGGREILDSANLQLSSLSLFPKKARSSRFNVETGIEENPLSMLKDRTLPMAIHPDTRNYLKFETHWRKDK